MTTTLASRRIIETASYNENADVTNEEAEQIIEAIYAGRVLNFHASPSQGRRQGREREVDLSVFKDPATGQIRYAVEVWRGARKWVLDFAEETAAREWAEDECQSLGI